MQNHQTLHASTTRNFAMSYTVFRSLWPTFHISFNIKGKSCVGHILTWLNTVLCIITKLGMVSLSNLFVIYRQTSITVNTQLT